MSVEVLLYKDAGAICEHGGSDLPGETFLLPVMRNLGRTRNSGRWRRWTKEIDNTQSGEQHCNQNSPFDPVRFFNRSRRRDFNHRIRTGTCMSGIDLTP